MYKNIKIKNLNLKKNILLSSKLIKKNIKNYF